MLNDFIKILFIHYKTAIIAMLPLRAIGTLLWKERVTTSTYLLWQLVNNNRPKIHRSWEWLFPLSIAGAIYVIK